MDYSESVVSMSFDLSITLIKVKKNRLNNENVYEIGYCISPKYVR